MLIIRRATADDTAAVAQLRADWVAEDHGTPIQDPDFEDNYRSWQENNPRTVFIAENNNALIGMLNLMVFSRMPKPGQQSSCWVYLGNAYVRPAHRNGGVGGKLMEAAILFSQGIRAARIILSPTAESQSFYQRFGFQAANELRVRTFQPEPENIQSQGPTEL